MNHFVYTLDIATPRPMSEEEQYDLRMAIDSLVENWPHEFEDWKTHWHTEERNI